MIPLLLNGVLLAGFLVLAKLAGSPDNWADEREHQNQQEREKWLILLAQSDFFIK